MLPFIDITRELLGAPVYPGDPAPRLHALSRMEEGAACNLSALSLCLHNGTHMDAPRHFVPGGDTIERIPPDVCAGLCRVVAWEGVMTGADVEQMPLRHRGGERVRRLLFKGAVALTPSAAFELSTRGLCLLGVEPQSVADHADAPAVHRQLLGEGVVLLEGLALADVDPGEYTLYAFPLKIEGADGAPVRAFLQPLAGDDLMVEPAFFRR